MRRYGRKISFSDKCKYDGLRGPYALANNLLRWYLNFCEGIWSSLVDSFLVVFIQQCDVVWNGNTIYILIYTTLPILICHIFDIYIYIHLTCVKLQIMEHKMHFLPMSTLLSFLYLWLSGIRAKKRKEKKRRSIK